jgi:hypothetical protein
MVIEKNYVVTKRIDVAEFFETEGPVEIEFKELDMLRTAKFQGFQGDSEKSVAYFLEVLPSVIVDHDFFRDEAHKYDAKEVTEILGSRAELCAFVMEEYVKNVLFTRGKKSVGK